MVAAQSPTLARPAIAIRADQTRFEKAVAMGRREPRVVVFGGIILILIVIGILRHC